MRVIGIDPAPAKGLAVFDGQDRHIPIDKSRSFIAHLAEQSDVLVCWDAPLTGPGAAVVSGGEGTDSSFSKRQIESFFSRTHTGFKAPKGISVLGYAGCPHWALTRSLVGLPRTGPFDDAKTPFELIGADLPRPGLVDTFSRSIPLWRFGCGASVKLHRMLCGFTKRTHNCAACSGTPFSRTNR